MKILFNNVKNYLKNKIGFVLLFNFYSKIKMYFRVKIKPKNMVKFNKVVINGNKYYQAEEMFNHHRESFKGIYKNTIRKIITVKKLEQDDYTFAKFVDDEWVECKRTYPRAKLLIKKNWCKNNIEKLKKVSSVETTEIKETKEEKETKEVKGDDYEDITKDCDEEKNIYEDCCTDTELCNDILSEPFPDILNLKDTEKFRDVNGKCLDIEVRGKRDAKNCFFKVTDVMFNFNMPHLNKVILHKEKGFEKNFHYKVFTNFTRVTNGHPSKKEQRVKKIIFLTHVGMLKVLFSSRSGNADHFVKWASEVLYTVQMGTQESKQKLTSKLGIPVKNVREVFNTNVGENISGVYLFTLGSVSQLRESMKIPLNYNDDMIVVKFGKTKNFMDRSVSLPNKDYNFPGVDIKLKFHCYIDESYISEAEEYLRNFFKNSVYDYDLYENKKELAIISKENIKSIEKEYQKISKIYSGKMREIIDKIRIMESEKEKDIINLKLEFQIKLNTEMSQRFEYEKENAVLKKEIELMNKFNDFIKHHN